jgi:uncharacterized protein (DUF58 family)
MTPTRLTLFGWGILIVLGLLIPFIDWFSRLWTISMGLFTGVLLLDFLLVRKRPELHFTRTVHHSLPVTAWSEIVLKVCNKDNQTRHVAVCEHIPADFTVKDMPVDFELTPGACAKIPYKVYPVRRGLFVLPGVDIAVRSQFRFWRKKWFYPCEEEVRVFPNYREIGHYLLLAVSHQLNQMGIKEIRQRGRGGEFHQLRDYRDGDELNKVDWKATSRHGHMISREFQTERDQQIVFMLDCGRRMRHEESKRSFFDQSLNAMLLLAHVAIRQGDAVGVYTFGGQDKWILPLKQDDAIRKLLHHTFDLHPTTEAADYITAASKVMALQRRRSLIVLLTNSRAEDLDDVLYGMTLLSRKHLVVVADLKESIIDETMECPVTNMDSALRYLSLQDYLNQRKALQKNFTHHRIQTLDVVADKLPAALVNRYLDIKSSGQL